jgi:hypothetical protein
VDDFTDTVPDAPQVAAVKDADDTDELPVLARDIPKYARAFLLFYRARRILSGNRNGHTVTREQALHAWLYLASLSLKDLPPILRQPHRDIVALAFQLQSETQSPVMFVSKILEITTYIDQIVDDLLTGTDKPYD